VLASVVSIWDVVAAPKGNTLVLTAAPKHLVVGVPLGLQLGQLVTFHAPFLNAVQVTPGLRASRLLSDMPYVGQVDLNENSDSTNVAMTATEGGFVVRGTVSEAAGCTPPYPPRLRAAGWVCRQVVGPAHEPQQEGCLQEQAGCCNCTFSGCVR
jgi:hypothetical protein